MDYSTISQDGILTKTMDRLKAGIQLFNFGGPYVGIKFRDEEDNSYTRTASKQKNYRDKLKAGNPEKHLLFSMENKDRVNKLKGCGSYHEQVLEMYINDKNLTYKQIAENFKIENHRAASIFYGARKTLKIFGEDMCLRVLKHLSDKRIGLLKVAAVESIKRDGKL